MDGDRQRAHRRAAPEIPEPPLVPLDLLPHPRQLPLHRQDVLEASGAGAEEVDQAGLEAAGIGDSCAHVHELLPHVLRGDVHRLHLTQGLKSGHEVVEAGRRHLHLERRLPVLSRTGLHHGVRHVSADPPGQAADIRQGRFERVDPDARRAGADDHHCGVVHQAEGEWVVGERGGGRDLAREGIPRDAGRRRGGTTDRVHRGGLGQRHRGRGVAALLLPAGSALAAREGGQGDGEAERE